MYLNAFRIRLAVMGAGLLSLCLYLAMGGRLGPPSEGVVQIEYGIEPEIFAGSQVAIDGRAVGALAPLGAPTRTGFEVEEGRHEVRLIGTRFHCRPRTVNVEAGHTVLLVLDFGGSVGSGDAAKPEVYFQ